MPHSDELAAALLPLVGGPSNVTSVAHCMTRLRLDLADRSLVDGEAVRALPGVLGVVEDDTYQVVLGPGAVARVTADFEALLVRREPSSVRTVLRRVANVFLPLIPALIGCGILAGVNGLLVNAGWLPSLTPALAAIASAFMSLIAVFVGYNTAKEFGGTPILGAAVAAVVVYPGWRR